MTTIVNLAAATGSSYIGYNNLVKSGAISVTSEATGYAKENAQSYKTSSWWQASAAGTVYFTIDMGAAVIVDSWGVMGHNLSDNSGSIQPQYSNDNFVSDINDMDDAQAPINGATIFRKSTSISYRYYRFKIISSGAASFIANLFLSEALLLPQGMTAGFSPAIFNREREIMNNISEGGQFLGRVLRTKGSKVNIKQSNIDPIWIRSNWTPLADSIELYPFYFAWATSKAEAAYCMAEKINYPLYQDNTYMTFSISCAAIYDV